MHQHNEKNKTTDMALVEEDILLMTVVSESNNNQAITKKNINI